MIGSFDSAAIHSNSECGIPATDPEFARSAFAARVLIVGASTRAAAWSAVRAGWRPVCADLFADEDLRQIAEVVSIAHYPDSLPHDLKHIVADAWMFTGAMENHLAPLDCLMPLDQFGRYCGPPLVAIEKLRDPAWLADRLRPLACYPEVVVHGCDRLLATAGPVTLREWLRKPLASGGGLEIQRVQTGDFSAVTSKTCYWQMYTAGTPMAAVFAVDEAGCRCLLVSEQVIGCPEISAPTEFTYCGSIGPLPISDKQTSQLTEIAETLVQGLNYRGLLGLDLIWNGRQFWLIEVNPRYTASCELWDFQSGRSAVGEHLRACGMALEEDGGPRRLGLASEDGRVLGKLILYADRDLVAPDLSRGLTSRPMWSIPWIADIPAQTSLIPAQSPVCTVFASAGSRDECERKLIRRAKRVRSWFAKNTRPRRKF